MASFFCKIQQKSVLKINKLLFHHELLASILMSLAKGDVSPWPTIGANNNSGNIELVYWQQNQWKLMFNDYWRNNSSFQIYIHSKSEDNRKVGGVEVDVGELYCWGM